MSLNKKDAAAYLGISTRALEYHVTQGHISTRKEKGATGDVAMFDEDELRRLKAKIDERRAPRVAVVREENESPEAEPRSLARLSDVQPSRPALETLAALMTTRAAVGDKIMLTLSDASSLTSLSANHLREAIRAGKLKGKIIGRGYKIKRSDLDAYVRKL
jgi:excisionase family DNA binding protein